MASSQFMTARSAIAAYGNNDRGKAYPRAEHPIVRIHPVTGQKCLFVNRFFTTHIVGLRKDESDAILEMLYSGISKRPSSVCASSGSQTRLRFGTTHRVQHHALWDYYPNRRYGHRVTVAATGRTERSEFDGVLV